MCMYSLYARRGYGMTNAKVGETLTRGEYRQHAVFKNGKGELACIKHGTTIAIAKMEFEPGVNRYYAEQYEGKPVMGVLVEHNRRAWGRHYAADMLQLADDVLVPLHMIKEGVTATIPRKVRKDKGITKPRNLSKLMGLDQLRAEIDPNPKPEDEATTPATPTEEPTPEPQREPETKPETAVTLVTA
jgi:hypothetical protein